MPDYAHIREKLRRERGKTLLVLLSLAAVSLLPLVISAAPRRAEPPAPPLPETQTVFGRYADRIVKIHITEKGSGAKAELGTGFFVSSEGHVMTNYHVLSQLVLHKDRYRAEIIDRLGARHPIEVLSVDVINDLAVAKADMRDVPFFRLGPVALRQGTRLYSLGFPHDIGITIVEGTYNGLIRTALYRKIHFTGSLNPGMSGGPAITAAGDVVGVNVMTAGEQVSFLVPAEAAADLLGSLGKARQEDGREALLAAVRSQLLAHQEVYFSDTLMTDSEAVRLGGYDLPSQPAPFFKCWGDTEQSEQQSYRVTEHQCSTDDFVYISGAHHSGVIEFTHQLVSSRELNRFQFSRLLTDMFRKSDGLFKGTEDDVTRFSCDAGMLGSGELRIKTAFCVRSYRKLPGLYDAFLKAVVLGRDREAVITTLTLSGVSFGKAQRISRNYLEAIRWAK